MRVRAWLRNLLRPKVEELLNGLTDDGDHERERDVQERERSRRELDELSNIMKQIVIERGLVQRHKPEGQDHERD